MAMDRFAEGCSYHEAIRILRLRSQSASTLPPDQAAQRSAILEIACRILETERDEVIRLGIHEFSHKDIPSPHDATAPRG